ncbi:MAG: hypothetical protein ABI844_17705 [Saprospiraceae bacterium]
MVQFSNPCYTVHVKNNAKIEKHIKPQFDVIAKNKIVMPVFSSFPVDPSSEDINQQYTEEMDLIPEDPSKSKVTNEDEKSWNEKEFKDDMSGDDLDVPGSELDDQQESVGSEDEENNYYSLGADYHEDLEEDKG